MSGSYFTEKSQEPQAQDISKVLGDSARYWETIKGYVLKNHGQFTEMWKYYGQKSGWLLKLLLHKRNILFFTPQSGYFSIGFVFGDKAVQEISESDLPADLKSSIMNARKYAEGRGVRLDVTSDRTQKYVCQLIDIKLRN